MVSEQLVVLAVIVLGLIGGLYWLRRLAAGSQDGRGPGVTSGDDNRERLRLEQLFDAFDRDELDRAAKLVPDSTPIERARNAHMEAEELLADSSAADIRVADGGPTQPVQRLENGAGAPEVVGDLKSGIRDALINRLSDADQHVQLAGRLPTDPSEGTVYDLPEDLARLDLSDIDSPRVRREHLDADGTVHYADVQRMGWSLKDDPIELDELLDLVECVRNERRRVERTIAAGERQFVREYERIERRTEMVRRDFDELAEPVDSWLTAVYFPDCERSRLDVDVRAAFGQGDDGALAGAAAPLRNCDFDAAVDSLRSKQFVATAVELSRLVRDAGRGVDTGRYDLSAGFQRGEHNPYLDGKLLETLRSKVGAAHDRSFDLTAVIEGRTVDFTPYDGGGSTARMSPRERQRVEDAIQMLEVVREGDERLVGYSVDRLPDYDGTVARNLDEFLDVVDSVESYATRFSTADELAGDAGENGNEGKRIEVEFADSGGAADARPAKALREEFESWHGNRQQGHGRR